MSKRTGKKKPYDDEGLPPDELYRQGKMPEMMKHWYSIRKQYPPEYLLAYRMGDFYEFFYDDAVKVSKLLGLTLTKRGMGPSRHPLAGIPHKAIQHFKTLVRQGQTVVIVEQLEDPKKATGKIVKRGVVRILSPGTVIDDSLLDHDSNNFICSIVKEKRTFGVAFIDISSGEFYIGEFSGQHAFNSVLSYIARYSPVECVLPQELVMDYKFMSHLRENTSMIIKEHSQFEFSYEQAYSTLLSLFKVQNLAGFGVEDYKVAIRAAGGVISFLKESQKAESLTNITKIVVIHDENFMYLDVNTQRNLELLYNQHDRDSSATLFGILNKTKTPMGTRLLKNYIVEPLIKLDMIKKRLDLVEFFVENFELRSEIRDALSHMGDLARLITRINYSSTVNARNLLSIKESLKTVKIIRSLLNEQLENSLDSERERVQSLIGEFISQLNSLDHVIDLIERSIHENPPTTITEGNIIKDGFNEQVDEYRNILNHGKDWIIKFEEKEKKKLGISTGLKIGYNRVLGYYIQITENALKNIKLPENYIQRQTLKGSVRFDTPELKEMETKIFSAEENLYDLEYKLFQEIRKEVQQYTAEIQKNSEILAKLDVLTALAEVAQDYDYCKPQIKNHKKIIIKNGRHPVVERINIRERFIPNDTLMDTEKEQVLIITGPNWSGKSTYLRQVALIVLMAQMGSFVPAQSAEIGIVDRIFTRIGASDDLSRGQSTFMLEMTETAQILHNITEKSLVIIDELGRGTGTIDGESISQAVIEYLHDFGVKTLFSTHFHKLITLNLPKIHNYHFKIIEKHETRELVFLRELVNGGTDKSYGIHVAMMAGLPERVINRAFELMESALEEDRESRYRKTIQNKNEEKHEKETPSLTYKQSKKESASLKRKHKKTIQTALFPVQKYDDSELVIFIKSLDINRMTPLEALNILAKLKEKIKKYNG